MLNWVKLVQSILTICQRGSSVLERLPVYEKRFFDEFRLLDVRLNDSKSFPRCWQQTRSGLLDRSLVCPTAKINWATLRQSPFLEKTRSPHRKPSWKTTTSLRPPSCKNRWNRRVKCRTALGREPAKMAQFSGLLCGPIRGSPIPCMTTKETKKAHSGTSDDT